MRWSFLAGCLALGSSPSVRAQSPVPAAPEGEPFRIPTVQVEEARTAPEPVHTAERRDPSGALTVIPIEEGGSAARDTAARLSTAPGVGVQDTGGWGQSKSVVVRGASASGTLVLLDGLPLNGAGGIADVSRVPVALAERIEVLRGGVGARYGSGGLGGVVNIITRRPGEHSRVAGELSTGAFGTSVGWLSATGPVLGTDTLVLLHGGLSRGDFPYRFDASPTLPGDALVEARRENNDARGAGALLRLRRELGGGFRADVLGELLLDDRGLAGTAQNPSPQSRQATGRGSASVRLEGALPGGGWLETRAFLRRDRLALTGGVWDGTDAQVQRVGSVEADARKRWGRHAVSVGASVGGEAVSAAETTASTNGEPVGFRASAMAMDEVRVWDERLMLAPSMRVERAGPYTLLSPKLGATLLLPGGLEVRANVGQAHRAPSFLELYVRQGTLLPNPNLRPERALYADVALAHRSEAAFASVGAYASLYEDLISYVAYPPGAARPYNFARARVVGLEAEGEWRPHPLVAGALSYTLTVSADLQRDGRFYLRELPYRPRHRLSARVGAGPRWLTARVEVQAQSAQTLSRDEVLSLPGRAFVHTGVSSTWGTGSELTVALDVRNVLDARAEDLVGYPLPGRAVYVSVSGAFEPGSKTP